MKFGLPLLSFLVLFSVSTAQADFLCEFRPEWCEKRRGTGRSSAPAAGGSNIRINPSAVPVERGFGLELIGYKTEADVSIVRGLGRVGAAISPSNSEETFFGPIGLEEDLERAQRLSLREKYRGPKITLAAGFELYNNSRSDLRKFQLNAGVLGRYNRLSGRTDPGAGLSGVLGPFTFGYSVYKDHHVLRDSGPQEEWRRTNYQVETASFGVFLNSIALDYSHLRLLHEEGDKSVTLYTVTYFARHGLMTLARREELADRPGFDFGEDQLITVDGPQVDFFLGVQINLHRNVMAGVFYNYYLVRETSVGLTLFF